MVSRRLGRPSLAGDSSTRDLFRGKRGGTSEFVGVGQGYGPDRSKLASIDRLMGGVFAEFFVVVSLMAIGSWFG